MEEDVELSEDKKKEVIAILKSTSFKGQTIHKHFYGINGKPRHGVDLKKCEEIYNQFKKIIAVTYRNSKAGRKYCFYYRINKDHSYKLLFFLDQKPPVLFNAIHSGKNIELKLLRKFGFKG